MNPKLFQGCDQNTCVITPGDHLCVVKSHVDLLFTSQYC
jgi:hypothetical protein